ncbi:MULTISPECIES: YqiA/YcfP family alpha/beta fold hydrolase [Pasteurellaceae]|uniref:YqiA/YcfP family alpha/beta fold hydrolase n=1 Tax=Pasteurella atlantica TaxID=2827233 RepID=A0AAW8CJI1_9PAST|nr:YqiA/YcfP family alpha/beta fold hydrolase [Pasteurella atlantica]MBR0574315.1 hypothetical protein [Pasteurella atlantica]MDP8040219.1 YqiA/YcfP family alpha/beta fold hydrolase [Pasteurella atlantica]MDP8042342.1 YqiA/YcfP family alpha/beta fold hydrolase [Pasteurella atlantica]MDP8044535.1 YqiA/YcfP family alpha/beta fold hydrolase [Pasteurella atlantica]MDP8046547.1 YqiA/YcfP family alpha/beta fold hydrolase [Pasteurella atlantica]
MFLYIHGFLSSSKSTKAQQLKKWLQQQGREEEWFCPDLLPNPQLAMQQLRELIFHTEKPIKLVGSSLGGFYATILSEEFDLKAILINPAVKVGKVLESRIGSHKAWHSNSNIIFTQRDVDILNNMDVREITKPNNFLLMIEKGDEILNYQLALTLYKDCNQLIFNDGNHGFSRFEKVLDLIDQF